MLNLSYLASNVNFILVKLLAMSEDFNHGVTF